MTEHTESYSFEIKDLSTERVIIFTFVDVTAEEARTVLGDFQRLVGEMSDTIVVNSLSLQIGATDGAPAAAR